MYSSEEQLGGSEPEPFDSEFQFSEQSIRLGFIRKVYSILVAQLSFTVFVIALFVYVEPIQKFSAQNPWIWIVAFVITMVCIVALACCPDVRRNFPTNVILLSVFTFFESILLGAVAGCYERWEVMMAVGVTAVVALALTIFAMQTKLDFTVLNAGLFVCLIVLIIFGFLAAIIRSHILNMVYACLGAILFSIYIVFDTQLMLGGKHKYTISPEEYIFAALNLYLDIINLFLFILSIIGGSRQ